MRERVPPKVHKSSILQMVDTEQVEHKPNISRLLHSMHLDNKNTSFNVRNSIKTWIEEQNSNTNQETFSGLLIQKDNIIIHFLESTNKKIEKFLAFIRENHTSKSTMTFSILALNERYSDRVFEYWASESVIVGELINSHSNISEDKVEERIWSVYEKFLIAGKTIKPRLLKEGAFNQAIIKQALDHLQISPEELEGLFSHYSFSLEEYFNLYHNSNDILLDNELIWPVEGYISELVEYSKEPYTKINGINLI